jgi:hypothetical protein
MRARSTTGSVAGAASYNIGLAAHSVRMAYPSCVLPKAPGPVRLTLPAPWSKSMAFWGIFMPLQPVTRPLPARDDLVAYMFHTWGVTIVDVVTCRWMELYQETTGSLLRYLHRSVSLTALGDLRHE